MGVGARGVLYTSVVVIGVLTIGLALGRLFRLDREVSLLISSGTGICGGSAIAAVGSAIRARGETMSVALAVVFVLNAVALYAFPGIGRLLELTQAQFAVWAALAIHDTSSVVGAATIYGEQALQQATVLKLARALWILPLALAAAIHTRRASRGGARQAGACGQRASPCPGSSCSLCWPPCFVRPAQPRRCPRSIRCPQRRARRCRSCCSSSAVA
jgi:uncharacterized membrane protein YadS